MRFLFLILFIVFSNSTYAEPPFELPSVNQVSKISGAIVTTTRGKLYVKLYPKSAPWHVANFKYLADLNFYDNLPIHIFRPGYLLQTGAPNRDPASGPNYTIPAEFNNYQHEFGVLSMVRRPDYLDIGHARNSHGSQFRIMLSDAPHMDGQFTVFGKVVSGFDVLKQLGKGDRIIDLTVYVR